MPKQSASKRAGALLLAAWAAGAAAAGTSATAGMQGEAAAPAGLRFEQAFDTRHTGSVQYEARFLSREGREQVLRVWRDGDTRLKRRTDDAMEIYAVHRPGDAEYAMTVLDLQRRILTRIDRTNLFRIGNFTDWFDLAHGLKHPRGEYTLRAASAPAGASAPVGACRWYDLAQGGVPSHVCWSARAQVPLAIVDGSGREVWKVTRLDTGRVPPSVFKVDARDYVLNNANEDIERD